MRVSVIVPIYRAVPEHLKISLESTYIALPDDGEILLGFDGPPSDAELKVVHDMHRRIGKRLSYRIMKHRGIAKTLNDLIKMTDSEFVARQDADDFCMPERFAAQIELLDVRRDVAFCGTQITRCNRDLVPYRIQRRYPERFVNQLAYGAVLNNPIAHPTLFLRRSDLGSVRYKEIDCAEDWQLYLDLWKAGRKSVNLSISGIMYRMHSSQLTGRSRDKDQMRRMRGESLTLLRRMDSFKGFPVSLVHCMTSKLYVEKLIEGWKKWRA